MQIYKVTKSMNKIIVCSLCFIYLTACYSSNIIADKQNSSNQTQSEKSLDVGHQKNSTPAPKINAKGEITNCSPEKFGRVAKLSVFLKTPNGGYLMIEREGKTPDYFLLSAPENSGDEEFAAAADSLPFWTVETLKILRRIELDTSNARAVNLSGLDKNGKGEAEPIFNQTGWYKIQLSDENFEQDDPVITGQCRVYFDKAENSIKNDKPPKNFDDKVISWNDETKNFSFETNLVLRNGQPFAFDLAGYRIIEREDFETVHECFFRVEKDKNGSVWKYEADKINISGKDGSGTPFQMFIKKTDNGFLIDTSAAGESCFNVGMPGDILLTRSGNKYNGKFIASKSAY